MNRRVRVLRVPNLWINLSLGNCKDEIGNEIGSGIKSVASNCYNNDINEIFRGSNFTERRVLFF